METIIEEDAPATSPSSEFISAADCEDYVNNGERPSLTIDDIVGSANKAILLNPASTEITAAETPNLKDTDGIISSEEDQLRNQQWSQGSGSSTSSGGYGNFSCNVCPQVFDKKLLLNTHMKVTHGISYVFTDRGNRIKLVRVPDKKPRPDGAAGASQSPSSSASPAPANENVSAAVTIDHVAETITTVSAGPLQTQTTTTTTTLKPIIDHDSEGEGDGVGCGFFVKIDTESYRKAKERKLTPFAAFFPVNYVKKGFLLKIKDCGERNHLLEPATKKDIIRASRASNSEMPKNSKFIVAIVAFVRQVYDPKAQSAAIIVDPPQDDVAKIKLMRHDQFTDFAFSIPIPCEMLSQTKDSDMEDGKRVNQEESNKNKDAANATIDVDRDDSTSEHNTSMGMPTLMAVDCNDSQSSLPELDANISGVSSSSSSLFEEIQYDSRPPKLTPEVRIKEEKQSQSQNNTPTASTTFNPICETPKRPLADINAKPLKPKSKRKVKQEQLENSEDDDLVGDITFAPKKSSASTVPVRKRGRPRKLKFEDCMNSTDEEEEKSLSKLVKPN